MGCGLSCGDVPVQRCHAELLPRPHPPAQNNMYFTTADQDNDAYDPYNCATKNHGNAGGFWYNNVRAACPSPDYAVQSVVRGVCDFGRCFDPPLPPIAPTSLEG